MKTYFESSAIAKIVLMDEGGREDAMRLLDQAGPLLISRLAYPEVRAGVAAAYRAGRIDDVGRTRAIRKIGQLVASAQVVEVTQGLASEAGELAERHALRGFDAMHLASALAVGNGDLLFVTFDRALGRAASGAGLLVSPAPL